MWYSVSYLFCIHGPGPSVRPFPCLGTAPLTAHCLRPQIIFEGVRGTSYEGDIAIDDVTLKTGDCPRKPIGPNKGEYVTRLEYTCEWAPGGRLEEERAWGGSDALI